jgi:cell division protein FtsI (penicillin-binding protein 3)
MRQLFRLNVLKGSGKRADVAGYGVGGKTGTAEKVENGRYSSNKRRNAFLAAFPMDAPKYLVLVILDEPKPERPGIGATAGLNTAPLAGNIIRRIAPMLGVEPKAVDPMDGEAMALAFAQ